MPFSKPSEFGGGSFFKPADHMEDLAILLEPKNVARNVPSTYQGTTRERDEVTTDITIFGTSESLEKGEPTTISKNSKVVHGMLTSTLERIVGGAMVGVVRKIPTKGGSGYVFRDVSPEVEAQVERYFAARDQERAQAADEMPDFD